MHTGRLERTNCVTNKTYTGCTSHWVALLPEVHARTGKSPPLGSTLYSLSPVGSFVCDVLHENVIRYAITKKKKPTSGVALSHILSKTCIKTHSWICHLVAFLPRQWHGRSLLSDRWTVCLTCSLLRLCAQRQIVISAVQCTLKLYHIWRYDKYIHSTRRGLSIDNLTNPFSSPSMKSILLNKRIEMRGRDKRQGTVLCTEMYRMDKVSIKSLVSNSIIHSRSKYHKRNTRNSKKSIIQWLCVQFATTAKKDSEWRGIKFEFYFDRQNTKIDQSIQWTNI